MKTIQMTEMLEKEDRDKVTEKIRRFNKMLIDPEKNLVTLVEKNKNAKILLL